MYCNKTVLWLEPCSPTLCLPQKICWGPNSCTHESEFVCLGIRSLELYKWRCNDHAGLEWGQPHAFSLLEEENWIQAEKMNKKSPITADSTNNRKANGALSNFGGHWVCLLLKSHEPNEAVKLVYAIYGPYVLCQRMCASSSKWWCADSKFSRKGLIQS